MTTSGVTSRAIGGGRSVAVIVPVDLAFVVHPWARPADLDRGRLLQHPQLALCDGDLHAIGTKDSPDRTVHVGAHVVYAVHRVSDPEPHLDAHAVVFELDQALDRRWSAQDAELMRHR